MATKSDFEKGAQAQRNVIVEALQARKKSAPGLSVNEAVGVARGARGATPGDLTKAEAGAAEPTRSGRTARPSTPPEPAQE